MRQLSRSALGLGALMAGALVFDVRPAAAAPGAPAASARASRAELLPGFDPGQRKQVDQRFVAPLARGNRALLTLDPALDGFVTGLLARYAVPYAGVAAVDPRTGKLLAYVSHSSAEPGARDQVRDATA